MSSKLCLAVCLLLALALTAPATAGAAAPVPGKWKGHETYWWSGGHWTRYTENYPLSFRLKRSGAVRFNAGKIEWTGCTGFAPGQSLITNEYVRKTKLYKSGGKWRFRGTRVVDVAGLTYTTSVMGRYRSARRGSGRFVAKLEGCGTYRSQWTAKGPKRKRRVTPPNNDGYIDPSPICIPYPYGGCWIL